MLQRHQDIQISHQTGTNQDNPLKGTIRIRKEEIKRIKMADDESLSIYDEIEIEDMTFDPNLQIYHYPCPCGDRFEICIDDLRDGEEIAVCPSCSLMIRVIFDEVGFFSPQD